MKHTSILALAICCGLAQAAPAIDPRVATMVGNCRLPMGQEVCAVENTDKAECAGSPDPMACRRARFTARYPNGKLMFTGRYTAEEIFLYVDAGKTMCDQIIAQCHADGSAWDARPCVLARTLWQAYTSAPPKSGIGGTGR